MRFMSGIGGTEESALKIEKVQGRAEAWQRRAARGLPGAALRRCSWHGLNLGPKTFGILFVLIFETIDLFRQVSIVEF